MFLWRRWYFYNILIYAYYFHIPKEILWELFTSLKTKHRCRQTTISWSLQVLSYSFSCRKICKFHDLDFAKNSIHNNSYPCLWQPIKMSQWIFVEYWHLQHLFMHECWQKFLCRKCKWVLFMENIAFGFSFIKTKSIYWNKCSSRHQIILLSPVNQIKQIKNRLFQNTYVKVT